MNQLKMDIQQTIGTLSRGGWSQRRIARELGIDREAVARYRRLARRAEAPKPAIPPAGSEVAYCNFINDVNDAYRNAILYVS
jgi:hypothetical protein